MSYQGGRERRRNKALFRFYSGDYVSRKQKKAILGVRLNKSKLRRLLATVRVIPSGNGYDSSTILPFAFCPKCGCQEVYFLDHMVQYPERWVDKFCARCRNMVGSSDNSPFRHCLEYPEHGWEFP